MTSNLSSPIWSVEGLSLSSESDIGIYEHQTALELAEGTLSFAVTADSVSGLQGLLSKDHTGYGDGGHITVWLDDGEIRVRLQSEKGSFQLRGGTLTDGQEEDIAITFGPEGMQLYVGGVLADQNSYKGGLVGNTEALVVGASQWGSSANTTDKLESYFSGSISDIDIYASALSAAEVAAIANPAEPADPVEPVDPVDPVEPEPEPDPDPVVLPAVSDGAPIAIKPTVDLSIAEGGRLRLDNVDLFVDPDGDLMRFTDLVAAPDFAYINGNGNLVIDPVNAGDNGSYSFEIIASDGTNTSNPVTLNVTVGGDTGDTGGVGGETPAPTNTTPEPTALTKSTIVKEGGDKQIDLSRYFVDADGDALTYSLAGAPDFVSVEGGTLSITPENGNDGTYTFAIVASDGKAASDPVVMSLTVRDSMTSSPDGDVPTTEGAPVALQPTFDLSIAEGGRKRVDGADLFVDPDGDLMRLTDLISAPDFAYINGNGNLVINPVNAGDNGTYSFEVAASDGTNTSNPVTINVTIGDDTGGESPVVEPPANTAPYPTQATKSVTTGEGSSKRIDLSSYFGDAEEDTLTYSLVGAPGFAGVDSNGRLTLSPQDGQDGSYSFQVIASDGEFDSEPLTVSLTVDDTIVPAPEPEPEPEPEPVDNSAPVVLQSDYTVSIAEGGRKRVTLSELFQDPDGDALSYTMQGAPDFASFNSNGNLVIDPVNAGDNGTYSFEVVASDGSFSSEALTFDVTIGDGVPGDTPDTGGGGTGGGGGGDYTPARYSLEAAKDILTKGTIGEQAWGAGVTVVGYDIKGRLAEVRYDKERKNGVDHHGFGVEGSGSRWHGQIDFYEGNGGRSERLVIDFNGDVTDVVLTVGMLGLDEFRGFDETGKWTAFDAAGKKVAQGLIGGDYSNLGENVKVPGTYGTFPIDIDTSIAFERLEIEATQFSHGDGRSHNKNYGENNSDFSVAAVDFTRIEPSDDLLFWAGLSEYHKQQFPHMRVLWGNCDLPSRKCLKFDVSCSCISRTAADFFQFRVGIAVPVHFEKIWLIWC